MDPKWSWTERQREEERELERAQWRLQWTIAKLVVAVVLVGVLGLFAVAALLDIVSWLVTPGGLAMMIVLVLGFVGGTWVLGKRDKRSAVTIVRSFPVGDLGTATGLVETCGRLRGSQLVTPVAKVRAVWFRVTVDDLSGDPPIIDFTMGEDLRIYDETGEASIVVKGATMRMERCMKKLSDESPDEIAALLRERGVEQPTFGSLRVREQWLAPDERVWVRAHVEAHTNDAYRSTTMVSLVGTEAEPVTIALEPLAAA